MIQIGSTFVCNAYEELGEISNYLDFLSKNKKNIENIDNDSIFDTLDFKKGGFEYHKKRIIVIAAVSFFEQEIYSIIKNTYMARKNSALKEFIGKIMERKYHTLFDFGDRNRNLNHFYGFFGDSFKKLCVDKEKEKNDDMSEPIKSFLMLNRLRNRLAHNGYNYHFNGSAEKYLINKDLTDESLYDAFKESCRMLNWFSKLLNEYEENKDGSN